MPDSAEVAALKQALAAQAETIALLKWALGGMGSAFVATCLFFVAWVRTLYDGRTADQKTDTEKRDAFLREVLEAVATLAQAMKLARPGGGGP